MTGPPNISKGRPFAVGQSILRSLLALLILGAMAAGCTSSDPRLDDSDVFGSPTPSAAPPSASAS
jgi:hypothetical protein